MILRDCTALRNEDSVGLAIRRILNRARFVSIRMYSRSPRTDCHLWKVVRHITPPRRLALFLQFRIDLFLRFFLRLVTVPIPGNLIIRQAQCAIHLLDKNIRADLGICCSRIPTVRTEVGSWMPAPTGHRLHKLNPPPRFEARRLDSWMRSIRFWRELYPTEEENQTP